MKKTLCMIATATMIGITTQSKAAEQNSQDTGFIHRHSERMRRRADGLPGDETKTPTSPDIVEHQRHFIVGGHLFPDKRIYFGVDESGNPCYLRIRQHAANNPEFAKVQAVIYHEAGKFSGETFENVGPVVQPDGRFNRRLVNSIGAGWFSEGKGGVWCPAQNVFIGGTRGTGRPNFDGIPTRNMCDEYQQFLQRPQPVSKFKK